MSSLRLPDGVSFINEERTLADRLLRKKASQWARVPRDREAMHFLIVGDSGTGKSAAIRQILAQIWERGEAAIVYDPALEYLPQFYSEARGDVILNPPSTAGARTGALATRSRTKPRRSPFPLRSSRSGP